MSGRHVAPSIRALSLTQPFASLIAVGAKRYESRSWSAKYVGKLAIHAARTKPDDYADLIAEEPFKTALAHAGALPFGTIVAVCYLDACYRTEAIAPKLDSRELAFGNYARGRFAFRVSRVMVLAAPIPCRGALNLWEVPADVVAQLESADMRPVGRLRVA